MSNASAWVTHLFLTGSKLVSHTAEWLPSSVFSSLPLRAGNFTRFELVTIPGLIIPALSS
jgi:hypothetical protein